MFTGFMLAAYSIVANDAIQTLGTFLSSNSHRPWWVLWAYACSVLIAVLVYGWVVNYGDVAYGRLAGASATPIATSTCPSSRSSPVRSSISRRKSFSTR